MDCFFISLIFHLYFSLFLLSVHHQCPVLTHAYSYYEHFFSANHTLDFPLTDTHRVTTAVQIHIIYLVTLLSGYRRHITGTSSARCYEVI